MSVLWGFLCDDKRNSRSTKKQKLLFLSGYQRGKALEFKMWLQNYFPLKLPETFNKYNRGEKKNKEVDIDKGEMREWLGRWKTREREH